MKKGRLSLLGVPFFHFKYYLARALILKQTSINAKLHYKNNAALVLIINKLHMKTKFFFLLFAIALLSATCKQENKGGDNPEPKKDEATVTEPKEEGIKWEVLLANRQSGVTEAMQVTALDQKQFDAAWSKIIANMDLVPEKPKVDFAKKMVLFICLGELGKGGHNLNIEKIEANGDAYNLTATHEVPGKNCMSTMSVEHPYWIVAVDKGKATKVNYNITKKEVDCK